MTAKKRPKRRTTRHKSRAKVTAKRKPARTGAHRISVGSNVAVKYVFVDVAGFSLRLVEDQIHIVSALNAAVNAALKTHGISAAQRILLPTGDGVCIGLLNHPEPDVHLLLALTVLERVANHNTSATVGDRRFHLRVGVHSGTDNLVSDVNARRNLAGPSINLAQRVMSLADESQILVSDTVYRDLEQRAGYKGWFREHDGVVKHGVTRKVFQIVCEREFLNRAVPSKLVEQKPKLVVNAVTADMIGALSHGELQDLDRAILSASFRSAGEEDRNLFVQSFSRARELPAVWRRDYKITYTIEDVPRRPDLRKVRAAFEWQFVNDTGKTETIEQQFGESSRVKLSQALRARWFSLTEAKLDGVSVLEAIAAEEGERQKGERYYRGRLSLTIPPSTAAKPSVSFRYVTESLHNRHEPSVLTSSRPIQGLSFDLRCPDNIAPRLFVLGMGSDDTPANPLPPTITSPKGYQWSYRGWLLRSHGYVMLLEKK